MYQSLVTWKRDPLGVYRQNSNKNGRKEGDLRSDGWRDRAGLGCDHWRNGRAQTNRCIRSLPPPFLHTPWLRVITISDLCFVSWGHQLWAPSASQTFHLLLPSARLSGTVECLVGGEVTRSSECVHGGCGGHTLESVHGGCGGHTLLDALTTADSSLICVAVFFFFGPTCGCSVRSNQWHVSFLWFSGITCWKTDLGTNLMGWCVIPAKMLPATPKNVSPFILSPFLPLLLPCSVF